MVEIRVPYIRYPRVQIDFLEPSQTQQHFKDETDINIILKNNPDVTQIRYVNNATPTFGDFSDALEYREALDRVLEAEESFAELPAEVRDRFHNDPAEFLDFATNPDNGDELVKMGLATSRPEELAQNEPTSPLGDASA